MVHEKFCSKDLEDMLDKIGMGKASQILLVREVKSEKIGKLFKFLSCHHFPFHLVGLEEGTVEMLHFFFLTPSILRVESVRAESVITLHGA